MALIDLLRRTPLSKDLNEEFCHKTSTIHLLILMAQRFFRNENLNVKKMPAEMSLNAWNRLINT